MAGDQITSSLHRSVNQLRLVALLCASLTGCTNYIALTKPTSPDFASVAVANDENGNPAVAIHKVSTTTHGFQVMSVANDQRVLYLLPNEYVVEVRCLRLFGPAPGYHQYSLNDYQEDTFSGFTFSVEAGKRYELDCEDSEDMADFVLKDADTHVVVKRFLE